MSPAEQHLEDMLRLYDVELPEPPEDDDDSFESWQRYEDELERLPRAVVAALRDLMAIELEAEGVVILPLPDDPEGDDDDPNGGVRKRGPPAENRKRAPATGALSDAKETSMNNAVAPCATQAFSDVCAPAPGSAPGAQP
jgi:hypothetical protein